MEKLTISAAIRILSEHGIKVQTPKKQEGAHTTASKIIFRKDLQRQRDLEIREQVIQEIMENRGISKEEALKIMANPF